MTEETESTPKTSSTTGGKEPGIAKWIASFPRSARVTFFLGLLLACLTAGEQVVRVFSKGNLTETWREAGIILLSLALTAAASWYAFDQRNYRRWSGALKDLKVGLTELEAVHPDALTAALRSVHDGQQAIDVEKELRDATYKLSKQLRNRSGMPDATLVTKVRNAASVALSPSLTIRDTSWMTTNSAAVNAAWSSMVRLREATQPTIDEVEPSAAAATSTPDRRSAATRVLGPEAQKSGISKGQAIPMATLLIGLIAAPAVATTVDGGNGDERVTGNSLEISIGNGMRQTTTTPPDEPPTTVPTTTQPRTRSGNLTDAQLTELQSLIGEDQSADDESLTAAVIQASGFDCSGFYETIVNIHTDHKGLPAGITTSPYWSLMETWCGNGKEIIEELNTIER